MEKEHIEYYKNGEVKGRGRVVDSKMDGYWEWFRTDGSKMRTGHFRANEQVGEWTTYDRHGKVVKVTDFDKKSKSAEVKSI